MKRIPLPNESEEGWQFDPSSIEHVIEAHLRRQDGHEKVMRRSGKAEPLRFKRGALGLSDAEIASIRWEALLWFLESARLPDELRERRSYYREKYEERVERFAKMPQELRDVEIEREADLHATIFARECEIAIARTTGHFADMLTQAAIASRGRKDFSLNFRAKLWAESLEFAMSLNPRHATEWAQRAWGIDPRESALPHLHRLDTFEEQRKENNKFVERFLHKFQARLRSGSPTWLGEAERRITLRCLLSYAPGRRETPEDKSKKTVAILLMATPGLTAKQVCGKLDASNERSPDNAPIPASWKRKGARSWTDGYEHFPNLVQPYISKVKRQFAKTARS